MPMRIRTVKPDFFTHKRLFTAEQETGLPLRIFFEGLWCASDREGRFAWKPDELKLAIIPWDKATAEQCLDALLERDYFKDYWHQGKRYAWIPSFKDHQQINARESVSRLPDPRLADGQKSRRAAAGQIDLLGAPPNGNGAPAKPEPRSSWSYRACKQWEDRFGNVANGGQIGKYLKKLIEKHGEEAVLESWGRYLEKKDAEFATPADFANHYNLWTEQGVTRQQRTSGRKGAPQTFDYEESTSLPKEIE